MIILFLSLARMDDLSQHFIYPDLLRAFVNHGHFVRIVSPVAGEPSRDIRKEGYAVLQVETPQMQKVGRIKKGIASLLIGPNIRHALDQYCKGEHYDLILMATPPVTLASVVAYVKKRDHAKVYLLLKDIWPQGIADLGAITQCGPIYQFYRAKEKRLYALSDHIGCMSPANVDYVLKHNPEIAPERVEVCPNSAEPLDMTISEDRRNELRERYGLPLDKTVFVYGGNFGPPQDVPFIIDCLRASEDRQDRLFFLCGTGSKFRELKDYVEERKPRNVLLLNGLPKDEYDELASACDVGLIFLDHRFTIPNFPSRLLSYLQAELPVLCCTDPNTDIGRTCEENGFGWDCRSNDVQAFSAAADEACAADRQAMGKCGKQYLLDHYTAEQGYEIIMKSLS